MLDAIPDTTATELHDAESHGLLRPSFSATHNHGRYHLRLPACFDCMQIRIFACVHIYIYRCCQCVRMCGCWCCMCIKSDLIARTSLLLWFASVSFLVGRSVSPSLSLYTFAVHVNRDLCSSEVVGLFEIHCSEIRKVLAQTSEDLLQMACGISFLE